ncbi:MAG TPA: cytochrome c1 [Accumulibacter sp.]|uniref:Cytochrome c1 n=2 Tax=Candidatus Accumulibacter TaxID=327159 RepID=A0A080M1V3_9PROT|nr:MULTISPECIES: cytochrome c1 [Candidatus Accumulibacter]KFB75051.1 MAG: Cytochrome c1 precursor [Candidatus Accumulibacter cognatus]MBL8402597.1 cytochrome c1 [Accumulibacter sp.]MBN8518514.1 cytochrome c1 [Accumulibacter sp.]MBO3712620.1 cytochrome c1 [Accumulibacter sp.]MCC2868142.1 cytochrome c1 [Candidatus Accumulibacter phosphatis]
MKKLLMALLFTPVIALASGASVHLDKAPDVQGDKAALQSGARTFVNYCLNCHGTSFVRYNRLTDLGLTEQQVKENLMFTAVKTGETMRIAARPDEQKIWFGAAPPDLSLVARARASEDGSGADWLYTYLRSFYVDEARPTGWNNTLFANVGMPHVLWQLQGQQVLNKDHHLELAVPGTLTPAEYDKQIGDLVGFLVWIAEPDAGFRRKIGFGVLAFLVLLFAVAYPLKKAYWKDVK